MRRITLLFLFFIIFRHSDSQPSDKISREEYIKTYWEIAVEEMERTGIPASITLAQGAFESENGNSYIARNANNHFGIKCRGSWDGDSIRYDDDKKNECFRKYKSVMDSYRDHSEFLSSSERYAFLFELDKTDYKAWAEGLKKAGYATNPKYPDFIIKIIEENKLFLYDNPKYVKKFRKSENQHNIAENEKKQGHEVKKDFNIDDFSFNPFGREVYVNNRVKYIIVKKGDNFNKISKEVDLTISQLARYNDISSDSVLIDGQVLFIGHKRYKAENLYEYHFVDPGETLYSISQFYAIRLKSLCRKNNLSKNSVLHPGDKLWLRKKKPGNY